MKHDLGISKIDWQPLLTRLVKKRDRLIYPGDLKAALLEYVGLQDQPKAEEAYQLAVQISRLTTCCDAEIIYWFSRLLVLIVD